MVPIKPEQLSNYEDMYPLAVDGIEQGTPAVFITVNAVAGRPNTDLAIKFIDFSIRAEAQDGFSPIFISGRLASARYGCP